MASLRAAALLALSAAASGDRPPGEVHAAAQAPTVTGLRALPAPEPAQLAQGQAVFNRHWVPAGAPGVGQGLGPLFNADSCVACHGPHGEGGAGPAGDGAAPATLVVQLETPATRPDAETQGDPVYGYVLSTSAVAGLRPEGVVTIHYTETEGRYYHDGFQWHMRVPHYRLSELSHGPLARTTVIKPRLAPPLFGAGLLATVPAAAIVDALPTDPGRRTGEPAWDSYRGARSLGRFGWQGRSVSVRDQTAKAFAREMGLTTSERPRDDCTPAEAECWQPHDVSPKVADELLDSVVSYVGALPVPEAPAALAPDSPGAELFATIGCAACHRPELPVEFTGADGQRARRVIAPYSDLRLHDLGMEMADQDASGTRVSSRWRTPPLWGLGDRSHRSGATFLHDGRARTLEEAILWHSGEAGHARRNFVALFPRHRAALLRWLESL